MALKLGTYEDLLSYLRAWSSWNSADAYDVVALAHLLGACLANLWEHANEAGIEQVVDCLGPQERAMLARLTEAKVHSN